MDDHPGLTPPGGAGPSGPGRPGSPPDHDDEDEDGSAAGKPVAGRTATDPAAADDAPAGRPAAGEGSRLPKGGRPEGYEPL
ncbi:MAG TPA: hypothetical protein VGM53_35985 [Streptosporangiaceae bacterium]|jgi:hypothetical protein